MPAPATSNFPYGFPAGFTVRGLPILQAQPGKVFWVSNSTTLEPNTVTGSDGNSGSYTRPLATINFAIHKCRANVGDIIMVKPGHAETISAASAITCDVAGVTIRGLGTGAARPTLTFGTSTSASVLITAANVTIENIVGVTAINALTQPFDVRAAGCWLDIEWQDPSTILEALRAVLTTAAADNLTINMHYLGQSGGSSCVNAVRLVGVDGARIEMDFFGKASGAVVEFVTTACTNVFIQGVMYNTTGNRLVTDTVTGSTWYAKLYDMSVGGPTEGGSGAGLSSTYVATVTAGILVPSADGSANTRERDVIGNKTDAAVYIPGTVNSLLAYAKGVADLQERVAKTTAAVMVSGNTIFTVAGGPIKIEALLSECVTANDATASTLLYTTTPTAGSAQTISAASASLANAAIGATITLAGTGLATAALLNANGANLIANPGTITVMPGTIKITIGTGSTTGTWRHYIRYKPLAAGVTVA